MNNLELIQNIAFETWAILPRYVYAQGALIKNIFDNANLSRFEIAQAKERAEKSAPVFYSASGNIIPQSIISASDISNIKEDSLAILSVFGVMQKSSTLCTKGTSETLNELQMAGKNNFVKGVVLRIDSPGGTVSGTEALAAEVRDFQKKYKKPVVAVIEDLGASAAYWVASQADKIFITGKTTEVGSIGTMTTVINQRQYFEDLGIDITNVYATKSFNKNAEMEAALNGDFEPLQKNRLDPINESFIEMVRSGRRGMLDLKKEENGVKLVFTGKTWAGQEAIDMGLADEFGDINSAMDWIKKRKKETNNSNNSNNFSTKNIENMGAKSFFASILASLGVTSFKKGDGSEVAIDKAIEGIDESQFNMTAFSDAADSKLKEFSASFDKQLSEIKATLLENSKNAAAQSQKIESLEKDLEAEKKRNEQISSEIAKGKGTPIAPKKQTEGNAGDLAGDLKTIEQSLENNAQAKQLKSWFEKGALNEANYTKMLQEIAQKNNE